MPKRTPGGRKGLHKKLTYVEFFLSFGSRASYGPFLEESGGGGKKRNLKLSLFFLSRFAKIVLIFFESGSLTLDSVEKK